MKMTYHDQRMLEVMHRSARRSMISGSLIKILILFFGDFEVAG